MSKDFGAQISSETLISMVSVVGVLIFATNLWWNTIIPQKRKELSLSKNKGEVKEYLQTLSESSLLDSEDSTENRAFERWLFADWLRKRTEPKSAALPFLKKAKWNSGDNPILVAFGAIMACVITASFLERL